MEKGIPAVIVTKTQDWITMEYEGKHFSLCVLKVKLQSGETETLLTSLNQKQLPIGKASRLYFKLWVVEISYNLIKSELQLENFSGKTVVSVKQVFYATMYLANLATFMTAESDVKIAEANAHKSLKYHRQSNRNRTIHILRKAFILLLLKPDAADRDAMLQRIVDTIAQNPVSILPNRPPVRSITRKKRFFIAKKSVV